MRIKEKLNGTINGKWGGLFISAFGLIITVIVMLIAIGRITGQYQEKIDTIENKTIPKLEDKIDTNNTKIEKNKEKIESYMNEIRAYFKSIDSTQRERLYLYYDLVKEVENIKKKIKLD